EATRGFSAPGQMAPAFTHSVIAARALSSNFPVGGIFTFSSHPSRRRSRLSSGFSADSKEPSSTAWWKASADERSRPPILVLVLWQELHLAANTGRIFFSKNSACSEVSARSETERGSRKSKR